MNKFAKRLRALWHRPQLDRDLEDEIAFHLAMSSEKSGSSEAARHRFGNSTALKESCRDLWAFTALEAWWQDIRSAFRSLKTSPLVSITAIVALGLGLGANCAVFTLISSALRFDMGIDHIERLVARHPGEGIDSASAATPIDFINLRREVKSLTDLAAYSFRPVNVSDSQALPERYWRAQMSSSGWAMVRQKPILGRSFGPADERPDSPPVVILSHRVWERRYGRDPAIVGKSLRMNDVDHTVLGVMPTGAQFPEDTDLWTPLKLRDIEDPAVRRNLLIFGRLAPGVTIAAAQAVVDGVARRAIAEKLNGPAIHVRPFLEMIGIYDQRTMLYATVLAVGFVLLIVCADVANLLLGRAAARAREISIRIAIGAGRARIIRQLLVESLLLASASGFLGWIVTGAWLQWADTSSNWRPSWIHFSMDLRSFAYLATITLGSGILFGLAPALQLAKVDVNSSIKDGGNAAAGPRGRKLAGMLVAFQMALCVVLLAASGVLIHSAINLYNAPLSIDPANVLTMRVELPETTYPTADKVTGFYRELKSTLAALPGVNSVTVASHLPLLGWRPFRGEVESAAGKPASPVQLSSLIVDTDYFATLAVHLRRGRDFDPAGAPSQVIVNESFAQRYWPGEDPIGKRVRSLGDHGPQPWLTITGVVADLQQDVMHPLARSPLLYLPYAADPQPSVFIIARTSVPPGNLIEPFRRAVQRLDENLPAQDTFSLAERIGRRRMEGTTFGGIFGMFAVVALLLAWLGLYAVVAHAVSRRTQEIGIRMAVGGTRRNIFGLVLQQGMRQVLGGFLAGLPLALLVTRMLSRQLVGVSPLDPATYSAVALIMMIAGLLGCAIPARKAIRIDPLAALRHE